MQLHTLQPKHALFAKKTRVGRGGKRGTMSGRGQKGQGAHAGRRMPHGLKEILQRLPKLRGVKNKSIWTKPQIVSLESLTQFSGEVTITADLLFKQGLVKDRKIAVKILNNGKLNQAINVQGLLLSKSAKEKIIAAGGTVK